MQIKCRNKMQSSLSESGTGYCSQNQKKKTQKHFFYYSQRGCGTQQLKNRDQIIRIDISGVSVTFTFLATKFFNYNGNEFQV